MSKLYFILTFLFLSLISCSSDSGLDESKEEIQADYITILSDIAEIDDFLLNTDNSVYITGRSYVFSKLKKINLNSDIATDVKTFEDLRFFYNKITSNSKGEILLSTNSPEIGDKIYAINNFLNPYYTLKTNSTNGIIDMRSTPNISAISYFNDDSIIVFDSSLNSLKLINTSKKNRNGYCRIWSF